MKKKMLVIIGIIILLGVVVTAFLVKGNRPFKNLSSNEIESVNVILIPPDRSYDLTESEIEEFVEILNGLVVYQKDNSYSSNEGQAIIIEVMTTNGAMTIINVTPFIVIDDVGYRANSDTCSRLNDFANLIERDPPSDYRPMIRVAGELYGDAGSSVMELSEDWAWIGVIEKAVQQHEPMPEDDFSSNSLPVGFEIYSSELEPDKIYIMVQEDHFVLYTKLVS